MVGTWCYRVGMTARKLSIALEEGTAEGAARAARRRGLSVSAWLNEAANAALQIEKGLAAVAAWEAEQGALSEEELAAADRLLDQPTRRRRTT